MKYIVLVSRYIVGLLFIISGLIKLNDPVGTSIKLQEYFEVFAADFSSFFHYLVPASLFLAMFLNVLEVILGIAVLAKFRFRLVAWILLMIIVFFTFLTFYSAYFNKVTDCGCFGDAIKLTPWESFTKDIILLFFILILFWKKGEVSKDYNPLRLDIAFGALTLVLVLLGRYAINHLPFIDFRAYEVGTDIPRAMKPSEELKYKYIMTRNGEEFEFERYPTEADYEFKELILTNPEAQPKITDYNIWNSQGDYTEETFKGNKLVIVIHDVKKADESSFEEINQLVSSLGQDIQPIVFTASDEASFDQFRHGVQLAVPYYFADMTVLKTIVRSNPGIFLMKNGTVMDKWHYNDVPNIAEVNEILR
ncbi:MAG: BT_3928 family protein [Bacteroidota bacterium]